MPKPSVAMSTLLQLSEREVDREAQRLGQINQRIAQAREQHKQLQDYRDEYTRQMNGRLQSGMPVDEMANLKRFILNLDSAVERQYESVLRLETLAQKQITVLQDRQKKKMSYEVLINRALAHERTLQARREQKQVDEYASTIGVYRNLNKARSA
jgi:flagellar FliJ protein